MEMEEFKNWEREVRETEIFKTLSGGFETAATRDLDKDKKKCCHEEGCEKDFKVEFFILDRDSLPKGKVQEGIQNIYDHLGYIYYRFAEMDFKNLDNHIDKCLITIESLAESLGIELELK